MAFTAYADNQELLDKLIEQSGKSQSVFIADIIDDYLKSYEQK